MKRITSVISAAALALALAVSPSPSVADKDSDAIAGIIALGLLGAAIAHDQDKNGNVTYQPNKKLSPRENAIGGCMLQGKRNVENAGGYNLHLEKVNSVRNVSGGKTSVSMVVTGYYPNGQKTSDVVCTVKNNQVISFINN